MLVSKTVVGATSPRVRISPCPPLPDMTTLGHARAPKLYVILERANPLKLFLSYRVKSWVTFILMKASVKTEDLL